LRLPHAAQVPLVPQIAPVLQFVPQQGCLSAPHAPHFDVEVEQRYPGAQLDPGQQACPLPPHAPHVPFMQTSVVAVQAPAQHG